MKPGFLSGLGQGLAVPAEPAITIAAVGAAGTVLTGAAAAFAADTGRAGILIHKSSPPGFSYRIARSVGLYYNESYKGRR